MINLYIPKKLPPRHNIADKFSQFLDFDFHSNSVTPKWIKDNNLKYNINLYRKNNLQFMELYSKENEIALVNFFRNIVENDFTPEEWEQKQRIKLAKIHVNRYFQDACYEAVRNRCIAWIDFENPRDNFEEYYEIGNSFLLNSRKYDKFLSSQKNLDYEQFSQRIKEILIDYIRDEYHRRTGQGKRTIWGTLKTEKTKLRKALQSWGIKDKKTIERYIFACNCLFKVFYPIGKGKKIKFQSPKEDEWKAATDIYNFRKNQHNKSEIIYSHNIKVNEMVEWIEESISALQIFLKITKRGLSTVSIDIDNPSRVFNEKKLVEQINDDLDWQQKNWQEQAQVDSLLKQEIQKLQNNHQSQQKSLYSLLLLCYGLNLRQPGTETLLWLNNIQIDQTNISHHLQVFRIQLLDKFCDKFNNKLQFYFQKTDEDFDKQLEQWKNKRQKSIEDGLRDYFKEEILSEVIKLNFRQKLATISSYEEKETTLQKQINQWSITKLNIVVDSYLLIQTSELIYKLIITNITIVIVFVNKYPLIIESLLLISEKLLKRQKELQKLIKRLSKFMQTTLEEVVGEIENES